MTNEELISKIKVEIERQQKENVNYDENGDFASYCDHSTWMALDSILTFVSGLEKSEFVPADLEEAANEFAEEEWDGMHDDAGNALFTQEYIEYSFIEGAKWQANHTPLPEDTVLFNKGVAEGKRLIMEEAVEKTVFQVTRKRTPVIMLTLDANEYKDGDKVHVIVIPNTDEK